MMGRALEVPSVEAPAVETDLGRELEARAYVERNVDRAKLEKDFGKGKADQVMDVLVRSEIERIPLSEVEAELSGLGVPKKTTENFFVGLQGGVPVSISPEISEGIAAAKESRFDAAVKSLERAKELGAPGAEQLIKEVREQETQHKVQIDNVEMNLKRRFSERGLGEGSDWAGEPRKGLEEGTGNSAVFSNLMTESASTRESVKEIFDRDLEIKRLEEQSRKNELTLEGEGRLKRLKRDNDNKLDELQNELSNPFANTPGGLLEGRLSQAFLKKAGKLDINIIEAKDRILILKREVEASEVMGLSFEAHMSRGELKLAEENALKLNVERASHVYENMLKKGYKFDKASEFLLNYFLRINDLRDGRFSRISFFPDKAVIEYKKLGGTVENGLEFTRKLNEVLSGTLELIDQSVDSSIRRRYKQIEDIENRAERDIQVLREGEISDPKAIQSLKEQAEKEVSALKDQINELGAISHGLKNPLTSPNGYLEIFRQELGGETSQIVEIISKEKKVISFKETDSFEAVTDLGETRIVRVYDGLQSGSEGNLESVFADKRGGSYLGKVVVLKDLEGKWLGEKGKKHRLFFEGGAHHAVPLGGEMIKRGINLELGRLLIESKISEVYEKFPEFFRDVEAFEMWQTPHPDNLMRSIFKVEMESQLTAEKERQGTPVPKNEFVNDLLEGVAVHGFPRGGEITHRRNLNIVEPAAREIAEAGFADGLFAHFAQAEAEGTIDLETTRSAIKKRFTDNGVPADKAEELTGILVKAVQEGKLDALRNAHAYGKGELTTRNPDGTYESTYSFGVRVVKGLKLIRAGFSRSETKSLMDHGVVGAVVGKIPLPGEIDAVKKEIDAAREAFGRLELDMEKFNRRESKRKDAEYKSNQEMIEKARSDLENLEQREPGGIEAERSTWGKLSESYKSLQQRDAEFERALERDVEAVKKFKETYEAFMRGEATEAEFDAADNNLKKTRRGIYSAALEFSKDAKEYADKEGDVLADLYNQVEGEALTANQAELIENSIIHKGLISSMKGLGMTGEGRNAEYSKARDNSAAIDKARIAVKAASSLGIKRQIEVPVVAREAVPLAEEALKAKQDMGNFIELYEQNPEVGKAYYFYNDLYRLDREDIRELSFKELSTFYGGFKDLGKGNINFHISRGVIWLTKGKVDTKNLARFYLNFGTNPETIHKAMEIVSQRLDSEGISQFDMKTWWHHNIPRTDRAVVYVSRVEAAKIERILKDVLSKNPELFVDKIPLFTKKLGKGISFAEDPGEGASFGSMISGVVQAGILEARAKGITTREGILREVQAEMRRRGIDPEKPYLKPIESRDSETGKKIQQERENLKQQFEKFVEQEEAPAVKKDSPFNDRLNDEGERRAVAPKVKEVLDELNVPRYGDSGDPTGSLAYQQRKMALFFLKESSKFLTPNYDNAILRQKDWDALAKKYPEGIPLSEFELLKRYLKQFKWEEYEKALTELNEKILRVRAAPIAAPEIKAAARKIVEEC